ncbi:hypothetical protein jhhlp_000136 [Lomentospora prolificans]|uniref:BRCT domain-containing protein n=1 Tax=Lomentospora prolificans TaxID=41688 RepID=A0A2N3NLN7_9PEZI|nr:hypothetical protein jhhlp_000136 [Lomentospora prolificans]
MDPESADEAPVAFDPSKPLKGVVVCCTSIPPNETKDIEQKTTNLGGVFTGDLTVDVTHLLVGEYDTAKYRHTAKSLAHVKAMDAGWIEALTRLWREDAPIDFAALEKAWQLLPLETGGDDASSFDNEEPPRRKRLMVCLTGFLNLEERTSLQEKITSNGADYSGELNRRCTHLIVAKPEGQKYLAARKWGLKVVSLEWLDQTIERGMILDEKYYDPLLPPEVRGKGACDEPETALGKRQRMLNSFVEADEPTRKLRKTASMKLSSQRETVWGDILGGSSKAPAEQNDAPAQEQDAPAPQGPQALAAVPAPVLPQLNPDAGIFSTSYFYIRNFDQRKYDILDQTITALGGRVCRTLDEVCLARAPYHPWHRFFIIPQDSTSVPAELSPSSLPANTNPDERPQVVTEFFIERCIHCKSLLDPQAHVLGRPFPWFPLPGFKDLVICSAGFSGIDLHHLDRAVQQLGAHFDETFRRKTSLLVCKDLKLVRKEKLRLALEHGIPVVREKWLWDCIAQGEKLPLVSYMFPELGQKVLEKTTEAKPVERTKSEPPPVKTIGGFVDVDAFEDEGPEKNAAAKSFATTASARYHTARTHIFDDRDDFTMGDVTAPRPLKEVAANAVSLSESSSNDHQTNEEEQLLPTAKQPQPNKSSSSSSSSSTTTEPSKPKTKQADADANDADQESRHLRDRERAHRQAQQVLAFSSKLTSLIDPNPQPPLHNPTDRRRRGILGRAASSSSTSALSKLAGPHEDSDAPTSAENRTRSVSVVEGEDGDGADADAAEGQSLLTQVAYDDPGAAEARAQILGRMAGEKVGGVDGAKRRRVRSS